MKARVALVTLVTIAGQAAGQVCLTQALPESYPYGTNSRTVDVGDYNGDGAPDLAVGDFTTGAIRVAFNAGDGVFSTATSYPMVGAGLMYGLCSGDVNGDGYTDVVACSYAGNTIAIRLNNGDGTLGPAAHIAQTGAPITPVLADLDGDGDNELIVTNFNNSSFSVYRNTGAGIFGAPVFFTTGLSPQGVVVRDINNDGWPDVITADWSGGTLSVFVNDGAGQFPTRIAYPVGNAPVYVTAVDLDGDHDLDLAATGYTFLSSGSITTYLNNGSGVFGSRRDISGGFSGPIGLVAGDLDGDGDNDLAVSNFFASRIDVLLNDGAANFSTRVGITPSGGGGGHYVLVGGDFSRLGRAEFAAARVDGGAAGGLTVWRGLCDGTNPISVFACPTGAASFDVRPLEPGATYQWEWFGPSGWTALANGTLTRADGTIEVFGANTPRLELDLNLSQGSPGGSYRCVMTDSAGTLVSAPGLLSTLASCPSVGDVNPRAIPVVTGEQVATPGSTAVYDYAGLVIEEGGFFELGSGETLNLSGGRGTLWVRAGAVLSINGVANGSIFSEGLVRLQITPQGWIANVRGGTVLLPPVVLPTPTNPIVPITPSVPPVIPPETGVVIGPGGPSIPGSGGGGGGVGGGGGSFTGGGGTYRIIAPELRVEGQMSFDATAEVTGSFTQTETGVLRMFIAGDEPGETYNQFLIGESAVMDGAVQIVLDPVMFGFTPSVGESFDMVIADGGITLAPGLEFKTMMTAAGAASLGLTLPTYASPFAMDPDALVEFPASLFDVALVNDGTTLRFTLNQAVCSAQTLATTAPSCGRDTAEFTVANPGSGPLTYQWQIEDAPGSETWTDLSAGFYDGLGTVLTPTGRTLGIRRPRFFASGTRMRCVVSGPCATVTTEAVALSVLDQTEEACGNCPICEADFDDNGGVDGGDLAAFFTAFEDGVLCADVDRNGGVDGGDLAFFFQLFEDGGCE